MKSAGTLALAFAALLGCGGDSTSGAGGSEASTGAGDDGEDAAAEEACLDFLAVVSAFGDDAGCAPSLDAAECAALSEEACARELGEAHSCLVGELTAARCTCVDGEGGEVLECDFDGLCEAQRDAYTACL